MLLHICCSVDSDFFIKSIKKKYKGTIIGYFCNSNIHPFEEYLLRFLDVKRSAKTYDVNVICGGYDVKSWFKSVRGLENEPERGRRCIKCFQVRVENSLNVANILNQDIITTTLLMSPKKKFDDLKDVLEQICNNQIQFIAPDFRKNGGTQEQFLLANQKSLYHQNYCGCIFAQNKKTKGYICNFNGELVNKNLINPIGKDILPGSILERVNLYFLVDKFTDLNLKYKIIKEKFLNYILLSCYGSDENGILDIFVLYNSFFEKEITKIKIMSSDDIEYANNGVIVLSLGKLNEILATIDNEQNNDIDDIFEENYSGIVDLESFTTINTDEDKLNKQIKYFVDNKDIDFIVNEQKDLFKFKKKEYKKRYQTTKELIKMPPKISVQNKIRRTITGSDGITPIIVINKINQKNIKLKIMNQMFIDFREILLRIR